MRTVIAGAHGKIARELTRQLVQQGHEVVGLVRNPEHNTDIENDGGTPVVIDLESSTPEEVAQVLTGADAVVFAAGAGPGSSAERKDTVDRGASVLLADAAEIAGVKRFVQVSSMGADSVRDGQRPDGLDDIFYAYLQAKLAAEEDLAARSSFSWTIVRPGGLTDDPATGRVRLSSKTGQGSVPRADVAAVIAALLDSRLGDRQVLELISGQETIADALASISR
ncbi:MULTISPECIES: SDR family oxidoreductase [unclassified Arthrobacter]|uniref:SDR family oxidoreductase n=1 Tax=unclassified Arthrobacter TaxID=235627 RepID=UPI001491BC8E|nr:MULTISPECIES: SDR family oxidoreductase [unclassified Arthrobacter]MBE0009289.1 SDR family NAD(P)-dependent oxidoreductase [Arthrobacter sp. AET 35A]NOJ63124.1 SDR family oxidoreductase [Arthrobacter sp. 147(2020)]